LQPDKHLDGFLFVVRVADIHVFGNTSTRDNGFLCAK
jgi:hypothetical protein